MPVQMRQKYSPAAFIVLLLEVVPVVAVVGDVGEVGPSVPSVPKSVFKIRLIGSISRLKLNKQLKEMAKIKRTNWQRLVILHRNFRK